MANIVAVDREKHAGKGWRAPANFLFAQSQALIPLVGQEITRAAVAMPIAFFQPSEGRFVMAAVASPIGGRNLFVGPAGQWLGAYVPAMLRAYPFLLLQAEGGGDNMVLCIDADSGAIVDLDGDAQPFFGGDHEPSTQLKAMLEFLQQFEHGRTATDLAVSALAAAGVVTPWPLAVSVDGREQKVEGLFRIDEAKLNALDDQKCAILRKSGAFMLAYAQLISMQHVALFPQLDRIQAQLAQPRPQTLPLGIDEAGNLLFN
jgi:hypothetical protein